MRLPGTRYQEHGWEQVRKMLGHCSLLAFVQCPPAELLDGAAAGRALDMYVDLTGEALREAGSRLRAEQAGNSYGDSVQELAMSLLYELQARPADWSAFCGAVAAEHARSGAFWEGPAGDAILRKKVNDMYAVLRDKVDSDNYQAACGRTCSPNKMYAYRMLDTAYGEIASLFGAWQQHAAQVAAILGRELAGAAQPIETRQLTSIASCRPEWIIRWSESLERFGDGAGPLHTRSKRFSSLKNSEEKIGTMLREIGDYEELSSNRDQDWLQDAGDAALWLEDLWRVCEAPEGDGPDQILPALEEEFPEEAPAPVPLFDSALASAVSLPPRYMELAWAAQNRAGVLEAQSLPVRLAVYLKMLGPADDSYPAEWLDPETGELPTMQQLAGLDQVSLPTLRKRRDLAIAALLAAAP